MAEGCSNSDDADMQLTEIFDKALEIYEKVIKSDQPLSDSMLQVDIKNCIKFLEKATHLINAAGVFSSNEQLEDIPTQNMKYLLIPALLGSLVLKAQSLDRVNVLETAEIYFKDFLKRVQDYEIVENLKFEDADDNLKEIQPKKLDLHQLAIQRNEKIKKYKEQKDNEAELKRLRSLLKSDDDEIHRNYYTTYIKNFVNTSLEELKIINQEKPLAKHLAETRAKGSCFSARENEREREYDVPTFQPIIIIKNELQKKVFGAGYPSLPTMTVEEFYRERVAEGIFPAHGSSHGKVLQEMTDPEKVKADEEREEIEKENEIENDDPKYLEKARNLDDYKDDHRRGWGNRMNRS